MIGIGLHQITAMQTNPIQLVNLAAEMGCSHVCVFVVSPAVMTAGNDVESDRFPVLKAEHEKSFRDAMANTGVRVSNIEFFPIMESTVVEEYRKYIELGARLGAKRAVCHIHETNHENALKKFQEFCGLASEHNIDVGLEFMGLTAGCKSLSEARKFISDSGVSNAGVALDALHFFRTGGRIEEIVELSPDEISYAQICDGSSLEFSNSYL